jgi:hypothetical protein
LWQSVTVLIELKHTNMRARKRPKCGKTTHFEGRSAKHKRTASLRCERAVQLKLKARPSIDASGGCSIWGLAA